MAGLTGLPTHGPDYGPDWPLGNTGNEFESWRESHGQGGLLDPTLLCYGGQGVGKTFIRYNIFLGPVGNADEWRD